MALVDLKSGKPLSAKQIKAEVMKIKGWSSERYQREYDILRNKTRNYERLTGKTSGSIKVNELLYTTAKAEKRYGANYRPSAQVQAIAEITSTGTAVFRERGASERVISRQEKLLKAQFSGFTSKSTEGAEIVGLYDEYKSGRLENTIKSKREEVETLELELEAAYADFDIESAQEIERELRETEKALRDLEEQKKRAPKTLSSLRQQLDSAAKSLREYQKTKQDEWKRKNPDAPASYAVGTP